MRHSRITLAVVASVFLSATLLSGADIGSSFVGQQLKQPVRSFSDSSGEYVWIAPGEFTMGCVAGDDTCYGGEKPAHRVKISRGFWVGSTEVTVRAFEQFVSTVGSRKGVFMPPKFPWQTAEHPVAAVPWRSAQAYCGWLGGRLPTEAEWEYAARGGRAGLRYPNGDDISGDDANIERTGGRDMFEQSAPVGYFPANDFGLYGMAGNSIEWTADWFDPDAYSNTPEGEIAIDPAGPDEDTGGRVVRGGSWKNSAWALRLSLRMSVVPEDPTEYIGFRCVVPEAR